MYVQYNSAKSNFQENQEIVRVELAGPLVNDRLLELHPLESKQNYPSVLETHKNFKHVR